MNPVLLAGALGALALAPLHAAGAPPPPFALTDPDGEALRLDRLSVRVAAHGPLALTELEMTFVNPEPYTLEGRFRGTLPPGATVSRFARDLEGTWMEGEVVERKKAKRTYSSAIASGGGASLLERSSANRFSAKVFPVPAGSTLKLLLAYTSRQPLDASGRRAVRVPLRGLPEIGDFSFRAVCRPLPGERVVLDGWLGRPRREVVGEEVVFSERLVQEGFRPGTDLVLRFQGPERAAGLTQLRAGDLVMTSVRARARRSAEEREPDEWVLLVDTSANHGLPPARRAAAAAAVLRELERSGARRTSLAVHAFDLEVAPMLRFRAGTGRAGELAALLEARGFLGATDLGAALRFVGAMARSDARTRNFLLITDAVPTQGALERAVLLDALGEVPPSAKLHVVTLAGEADTSLAEALAARGRGRVVDVPATAFFEREAADAVAALRKEEGETLEVEDPGAAWVHPTTLRDVQPGEERLVFSRLRPGESSRLALTGDQGTRWVVSEEPFAVPGFAPLLRREGIRARIAHLQDQEAEASSHAALQELRREQVELSVRHRVLCSQTSLLILNFEEDYERYGIDRRDLAELLVVGEHGVALKGRAREELRTFTDEEWAAAKAAQRERGFPAGRDPLIRLKPPPGTRRVVALFPWGETKLLQPDPRDGYWKARFVIPRWLAHGSYRVVLVLTDAEGAKRRLIVRFGADRRRPEGDGSGRVWRTPDGWTVRLVVTASADTARAEARLPGGARRALRSTGTPGEFELVFDLREAPGPTLRVPVTLFDDAHNPMTLEVEVELR